MAKYSIESFDWFFSAEPNDEDNYIDCKLRKDNKEGEIVAYARLYPIHNNIHKEDYGLIEDVFVYEKYRRLGIGFNLIKHIIVYAKESNMYKIIATSRFSREYVHKFYEDLGLEKYGYEFRMDL